MDTLRTQDIAANSPRFRRKSSTYVDAIHDLLDAPKLAPAQLYSTESGQLFHSGRIAIATVGLPARGKTLGVNTRVFHLGDYRRATLGPGKDVPDDYFFVNASEPTVHLRQMILKKCLEDVYHFLHHENGQVAIYDAVNALSAGRRSLAKHFAEYGIQTLFIESTCYDNKIIEENVRNVKISSPDYLGWNADEAVKHYLARIAAKIPHFESMDETDLDYVKMINAGERVMVNNNNFGYLSNRIVFYLLNLHIKARKTYFARAGTSSEEDSYKADGSLSSEGEEYAKALGDTLVRHREEERNDLIARGGSDGPLRPLTVWTSTRRRNIETASYLQKRGFKVRQRAQMSQLNPGVCEKLSESTIRREYSDEIAKHEADPYHHRYPRAESYHDLAVRLEPVILELERERNDLLIVAHESVLRVLYGYLMACSTADIPKLKFPRNEIIIPASYNNEAKRIRIPNVPEEIIPDSPEDINIPVPTSGWVSPTAGIGTPLQPIGEGLKSEGLLKPNAGGSTLYVQGSRVVPSNPCASDSAVDHRVSSLELRFNPNPQPVMEVGEAVATTTESGATEASFLSRNWWGIALVLISPDDDDFDRRPQRRRYEEPPVIKIRKQLLSIAESLRKPEDEIFSISQALIENYDDEELRNNILDLILQLTVEQPFKIPFIAAVVLVSNPQKPDIAKEALARAASDARKYLEDGSLRQFKLVLRFLGCLQGLFEGDGVFTVLEELFLRAVDLQTASSEDGLGLELVKIILLTIPYILSSSALGFEQHAASLLEKTDIIASTPHALEALVDPYPGEEKPREPVSVLSLIQKQLQTEAGRDWELACIPRVWRLPLGEDGQDPLATATKHAFPEISIPRSVNPGPKPLFPEVFFSAYADQEVETVPPSTEIASSLLRDALIDTINILDFNRNATARFLIDIDCYFSTDTFIKRATPFDRLKEVAGDKSTWKPEDVAVDAVFSQLFQLPTPEHKLVYYHSVLTEACKIAPAAIAPSLGRAIRFLYRNVDAMDMELSFRFLDWFSHHLSNFGFTWKWTEWSDDVELPDVHPKKAFIIGALEKEIRLSFAQRIRGTLPEPYQALVSEAKEKDAPDFKYDFDGTPYALEGKEVMALLRKKAPEEDIQAILNLVQEKAVGMGVADPLIPSTDAYVTSICAIGSKSLSHVLSCIERCKERLLAIGPQSETARRQIITSVMDYWKDQPGIGVNIIDKLLNYTILTPMSVIEWALIYHNDQGRNLAKSHTYEMVFTTVFKVTNRVRQIVAARDQEGLPEDQVSMLNETLVREREEQKVMFRVIEDSLINPANGLKDVKMENGSSESMEEKLLRKWPGRWLKVFQRKLAVEEAVVGDAVKSQDKMEA